MPKRKVYIAGEIKNRILATIDVAMIAIEKKVRTGKATDEDLEKMKLLAGILGSLEEKVQAQPAPIKKAQVTPEELEKLLGK